MNRVIYTGVLMLLFAMLSSGCSDPQSRLGKAFDRGLARYKEAKAAGTDPSRPTASSGLARLGGTYKHYFAVPVDLKPLLEGGATGRALLRQAASGHPDPDGRFLASQCLRILDSGRKVRFQLSGPFRSPWMAYHYD